MSHTPVTEPTRHPESTKTHEVVRKVQLLGNVDPLPSVDLLGQPIHLVDSPGAHIHLRVLFREKITIKTKKMSFYLVFAQNQWGHPFIFLEPLKRMKIFRIFSIQNRVNINIARKTVELEIDAATLNFDMAPERAQHLVTLLKETWLDVTTRMTPSQFWEFKIQSYSFCQFLERQLNLDLTEPDPMIQHIDEMFETLADFSIAERTRHDLVQQLFDLTNHHNVFHIYNRILEVLVDDTIAEAAAAIFLDLFISFFQSVPLDLPESEHLFELKLKVMQALETLASNFPDLADSENVGQIGESFFHYLNCLPAPSFWHLRSEIRFRSEMELLVPCTNQIVLVLLSFLDNKLVLNNNLTIPFTVLSSTKRLKQWEDFAAEIPYLPNSELISDDLRNALYSIDPTLSSTHVRFYPQLVDGPKGNVYLFCYRNQPISQDIQIDPKQLLPFELSEMCLNQGFLGAPIAASLGDLERTQMAHVLRFCEISSLPSVGVGVYIGFAGFYASNEGMGVWTEDFQLPVKLVKEEMVNEQEMYFLQSLHLKDDRDMDIWDDDEEFSSNFKDIMENFAEKYGVCLTDFHDFEMFPLNSERSQWGMFFAKNFTVEEAEELEKSNPNGRFVSVDLMGKFMLKTHFSKVYTQYMIRTHRLRTKILQDSTEMLQLKRQLDGEELESRLTEMRNTINDNRGTVQYNWNIINKLVYTHKLYLWAVEDPCDLGTFHHTITDYVSEEEKDSISFFEVVSKAQRINYDLAQADYDLVTKLLQGFEHVPPKQQIIHQKIPSVSDFGPDGHIDTGKPCIPTLRPLEEITDAIPKVEKFDIAFTLEDLLDYVSYSYSAEDFCYAMVYEIIEYALVEALDVAMIMEVERCLFDCIELVEITNNIVEDTCLLHVEQETRRQFEEERQQFTEKLASIYETPFDILEPHERNVDQKVVYKSLTASPYADVAAILNRKFSSVVDKFSSLFDHLDYLHDLEQIIETSSELTHLSKANLKEAKSKVTRDRRRYLKTLTKAKKEAEAAARQGSIEEPKPETPKRSKTRTPTRTPRRRGLTKPKVTPFGMRRPKPSPKPQKTSRKRRRQVDETSEPIPLTVNLSLPEILVKAAMEGELDSM